MPSTISYDYDVTVVGAGPAGLTTALLLAIKGVKTIIVEKRPGISPHPRAIGFTARTLEIFRSIGGIDIEPAPVGFKLRRQRIESLAGTWYEESSWGGPPGKAPGGGQAKETPVEYSPVRGAAIPQDKLEAILLERARQLGVVVHHSTSLDDFEQDSEGVTCILSSATAPSMSSPSPSPMKLRSRYLVAADGGKSDVRQALGIDRRGRGHIRTVRSVLFYASQLDEYLSKGVHQFSISQPGFEAFLTTYSDSRWVLMFSDDQERNDEILRQSIARATGRPELQPEIITTGRWELCALVADRFSEGRVFLAGDAAHQLPPNRGGYGANTGIDDAHNLAWKLAQVLKAKASPKLLDSYDAERRPIAWLRLKQIFAREDYAKDAQGIADGVELIDDNAMEFGQLYRSEAVISDYVDAPPARRPDQWNGQPGTRAPHQWVLSSHDKTRTSTLDLFNKGSFCLLATHDSWRGRTPTDVDCLVIGQDVLPDKGCSAEDLASKFGLQKGAACLVRPDGYIAWRSMADGSEEELQQALTAIQGL